MCEWRVFKMNLKYLILFLCFCVSTTVSQNIPQYLLPCYQGNNTQPWVGNTMQLLVELIRKIEDKYPTSLDMRTLSVNLLHRLRLDGIQKAPGIQETEFVTPYGAHGIMAPKFRLLLQLVSQTPGPMEFENILTQFELCTLHKLISLSVEPFERGDESRNCPLTLMTEEKIQAPWITQNRFQNFTTGGKTKFSRSVSRCPIEMGSIRTYDYGSVSPAVFIGSVAAGLQPQNVRISEFILQQHTKDRYENLETMEKLDTSKRLRSLLKSINSIDNTYSVGLSGDLAEVCTFQGPYGNNFTIGVSGTWNDTYFPRVRYLAQNHRARWDMTESELLAGLDGLFISQQVSSWVSRVRRIRLSHLLDMYYSSRGIPSLAIETTRRKISGYQKQDKIEIHDFNDPDFNKKTGFKSKYKTTVFEDAIGELESLTKRNVVLDRFSYSDDISSACDRRKILEAIDKEKLKDETFFMAQILQYTTSTIAVEESTMRQNCDTAVDRFFDLATVLLDTLPNCHQIPSHNRKPEVDLFLIIDGSRRQYENLQLISHISELTEVSSFGSYLSVIHGTSGEFIVNRTESVASAFEQLRNFSGPFPTTLSLSRSLATLVRALNNQTQMEEDARNIAAPSQVVLIMSQAERIVQSDFDSARRMIEGSLQRFPDLYFIFVTNDASTFEELINPDFISQSVQMSQRFTNLMRPEHFIIIRSDSTNINDFSDTLIREIRKIPKRIIDPPCLTEEQIRAKRHEDMFSLRDEHEEYVSPSQEIVYRISSSNIRFSRSVDVKFQGFSYGTLTICTSREVSGVPDNCQILRDSDTIWFNTTRPCENVLECAPIYFTVQMDSSNVMCSENDCRYPDQVRFTLKHYGLLCDTNRNGALRNTHYSVFLALITVFYIVMQIN